MKIYDRLCAPAKFYFILSTVSYIFILLQNLSHDGHFTLGMYSCRHSNTTILLLIQALYIVLWTWLLNMICKWNKNISWLIVLFPFILFFIALGLVLFQGIRKDRREGMGEMSQVTF